MKHDAIVKQVYKRLRRNSNLEDIVCREEEFLSYGCGVGEVDVYRIHNNVAVAVEVKTNDHWKARNKAKYQLEKDAIFLRECYKIERYTGFYAYSNPADRSSYQIKKVIEYDFRK